jgi:uncharacterized protein
MAPALAEILRPSLGFSRCRHSSGPLSLASSAFPLGRHLADRRQHLARHHLHHLRRPPHPRFFATAADFYGAEDWIRHWSSIGFRVLRNQSVLLELPKGQLRLAGLDDESGKPDVQATFAEASTLQPCLILAHQPRAIHRLEERKGLVLSGHTHAGQIWPFGYVVLLVQPYLQGLHEHKSGLWIHVSPGTGFWGPPLRLGTRCEITLIQA